MLNTTIIIMCYIQFGPSDKCISARVSDFKICLPVGKHFFTNVAPYSDYTVLHLQTSAFIWHSNDTKTTTNILVGPIHNPAIYVSIICVISKYLGGEDYMYPCIHPTGTTTINT